MQFDLEVPPATRTCHATGRTIDPGEAFYSEVVWEDGAVVRRDYAADTWRGGNDGAIAWWRCPCADGESVKPKLAPRDVLLNLFAELADQPAEAEFRYVLGLLLVRRRLLRIEENRVDATGVAWLRLDCPSRNEQFELPAAEPAPDRAAAVEQRLMGILYDQ
ncbi:MAG: hypothetical protein KDA44_14760 [Planctomycetales bacterium]|nr:hypothetical protein [Planctomycetales bacterium]